MATQILLNETTVVVNGSPTLFRAGASISDPSIQAAILAEGGILWPATDPNMVAAQAVVQTKLRPRGADEHYSTAAMVAAAAESAGLTGFSTAPQAGYRVRNASLANVANLAAYTVAGNDGITNVAGDVVLLVAQTTASQNGPWVVGTVAGSTAPLTRPTWWPTGQAVPSGVIFQVSEGTQFANSEWKATSAGAITIDTTAMPLYPRTLKGTQALTGGAATVSNLWILAGAVPACTDQTAAAAVKATVTAGAGNGSLALTGTTTDVIGYLVVNW